MDDKKIEYKDEDGKRVIYLPEMFEVTVVEMLKKDILEVVDDAKSDIIIDLKNTEFIDSTGIGTIILIIKDLMKDQKTLYIRNASGIVKECLEIAKIFKFSKLIESNNE